MSDIVLFQLTFSIKINYENNQLRCLSCKSNQGKMTLGLVTVIAARLAYSANQGVTKRTVYYTKQFEVKTPNFDNEPFTCLRAAIYICLQS